MRLAVLLTLASLAACRHEEPPRTAAEPEEHYGVTIEDGEAWNLAHPDRCKNASRTSDCIGVREYLADFPKGAHAAEARALLDALPARLAKLPEETLWEAADALACKKADDIESCDDVAEYLAKFPMGKHAAEARALLDASRPILDERRRALNEAGVDIELLGTDHTGKDCPPLLGDGEHQALCIVVDVRVRRALKTAAVGVTTDCGDGQERRLFWATARDLTKVKIGNTIDAHIAVPREKKCTIEIGLGNVPKLEREGLRRLCLHAADDPKKDYAEPGSCH